MLPLHITTCSANPPNLSREPNGVYQCSVLVRHLVWPLLAQDFRAVTRQLVSCKRQGPWLRLPDPHAHGHPSHRRPIRESTELACSRRLIVSPTEQIRRLSLPSMPFQLDIGDFTSAQPFTGEHQGAMSMHETLSGNEGPMLHTVASPLEHKFPQPTFHYILRTTITAEYNALLGTP